MDNNSSANHRASGKFILAGGALGVVFGDIGTSPLYTLKTISVLSALEGLNIIFPEAHSFILPATVVILV